jgi:hypothetical protein
VYPPRRCKSHKRRGSFERLLGATTFPRMKHRASQLVRALQRDTVTLFLGQGMVVVSYDDGRPIPWARRPDFDWQPPGGRFVRQRRVELASVSRMAESEESSPRTHRVTVSLTLDEHPHQPPKHVARSANGKIQASPHEVGSAINDTVILRERYSLAPLPAGDLEDC